MKVMHDVLYVLIIIMKAMIFVCYLVNLFDIISILIVWIDGFGMHCCYTTSLFSSLPMWCNSGQNTCPMCRRDVFEGMNHDHDDDEIIRAPPPSARRVSPPPQAQQPAAAAAPVVSPEALTPVPPANHGGDVAVGPNLALHDDLDDGREEGQQ
jgi:hypothetical protein